MAKHKLTAELTAESIRRLRNELLNYKANELPRKLEMLLKSLSEVGVEYAKARIVTYDAIFTGELLDSIKAEKQGGTNSTAVFVIVADSKHAAFVEFGTGQMGLEGSYPHQFPEGIEWNYNTGKTIFEIAPGEYGWFFPMPDGTWAFTQGMPSRPFMHETTIELISRVTKIAREVFN